MVRISYQTLLILAIVSALISCQASTADTSSDASAQCTIKSIEETILDAEGACRCTYSENGQTLIGPGYSIATQAQQQQLQTIFSFDADTLQKVVSGDQPLKTPQLLQLLQSAADQAVADLTTVFNDFDSYPSTAKIALVKIYHDIGLPAIKQMTLFVTHVNREDFDEAALLLQYVDDSKTEQTDYCLKQAAACAGNADLLGTCIDQQIEQGNPQNPPVVDDLPVGRQCIIDTCPAILTNNLQSVLFRNNLDFASETTLYDFYSDLLQIYNNHSSGSAAQYSDTTFQTFFNSFWNCLETCANTKPSSVYNALTKLTDEESSYFEFNANPDHNNCLGAWDRFLIAQYQELTDYEDYSFREVIKSIRIYLTKKASDFCSDDMIYDRLSVILNQYDPPLVTVPPSPTSDELTDYLIQTLSTTTCNNVGTCQSSTQTLAPKPTSTSQQVMGPDDTSDDTTSSDSTDTASTQAPAPDATTTSSDASTSSSDASTSSSDASSSSSDASSSSSDATTSSSDSSTSSSDSTPDAATTSTDSSSSSSTPKKKKKYSSKAVSSSDSSSSSSSSSNSTTGSSNLVAIACSSVLLILSLLF